jgi:hypothetical protein
MAGGDQAREALTGAPRTVVPHGEGPSSAGGRPLQTPNAPDTPTPPRYATEADIPSLLAEVERERELRTDWFERCRNAEAERNVQRIRAEKAEALLSAVRGWACSCPRLACGCVREVMEITRPSAAREEG